MRTICRTFEVKEGKTWRETYRTEDTAKVYEDLAYELLNLKVFKSPRYRRLEQHSNYDGTRNITIYQDTGRSIYTIRG